MAPAYVADQRRSLYLVSSMVVELDRGMGSTIPTQALNASTAIAAAISFRCLMTIPRFWLAPTEPDTAFIQSTGVQNMGAIGG